MSEGPTPNSEDNHEGERRAKLARKDLWASILVSGIGAVGATLFFFVGLPEKMKEFTSKLDDHEVRLRTMESSNIGQHASDYEARLRTLESQSSEHAATLGRIDERTKSIQESLSEIKQRIQRQ